MSKGKYANEIFAITFAFAPDSVIMYGFSNLPFTAFHQKKALQPVPTLLHLHKICSFRARKPHNTGDDTSAQESPQVAALRQV